VGQESAKAVTFGKNGGMATSDKVEHTPDGRYIVAHGRKWRATDPGIPKALATELVAELMTARRAVCTDPASARARVQDAKAALGERGEFWWDQPSQEGTRSRLAATIRTLLRHRAADSTICPSDAARVVGGHHWRELMDSAREVVIALHRDGTLHVSQHGQNIDPASATGPIRLGRGPTFDG
jgi:hypothetical protein